MNNHNDYLKLVSELHRDGNISDVSYQLGINLAQYEDRAQDKQLCALITACLVSAMEQGDVCINITEISDIGLTARSKISDLYEIELPSLPPEQVLILNCVSEPSSTKNTPFILDEELLYIKRSYNDESVVSRAFGVSGLVDVDIDKCNKALSSLFGRPYDHLWNALQRKVNDPLETCFDTLNIVDKQHIDTKQTLRVLREAKSPCDLLPLNDLIPDNSILDWQKIAVATALVNRFSIISGGPGTGKTTTVCKLLAALCMLSRGSTNPVIKIAAPTGKAAARLTESITQTVGSLELDEKTLSAIPTESSTIHRLLGATYGKSDYRFNKNNKLNVDILVIDEASMVDLSMMAKIVHALPDHARLILLGDKDQLSSVDAGSVLGDICSFNESGQSKELIKTVNALTNFSVPSLGVAGGVADKICILQKSYRFHSKSGIGVLANAINKGFYNKAKSALEGGYNDIHFTNLDDQTYPNLITQVCNSYKDFIKHANNSDAELSLRSFSKARLLCAVRDTDFGVKKTNLVIEKTLARDKKITDQNQGIWYVGRPVMITRNDYGLGLHNGDVGITMYDSNGTLKVFFEMQDGSIKGFLTSRIPDHELAYCMTIHKSQGSEFDHTYILVPPTRSKVLTRELIYTAITRAKKQLTLYATQESLTHAIKSTTVRHSGLKKQLEKLSHD